MFSTTLKYMIIGTTSVGLMAGCANNSAAVYTSGQAQKAQTVQLGTVMAVKDVKIEGKNNQLITIAGTALGGLAGSQVSHGTESAIAAVAGAVIAGLGTQAIQQGMANAGYEITVELDNKTVISIVQKADVQMTPGMRVRVLSGDGVDRVLPL